MDSSSVYYDRPEGTSSLGKSGIPREGPKQRRVVPRARRFYESDFGWSFEPWGPPGFFLIKTGTDQDPGVHGALQKRETPVTGSSMIGSGFGKMARIRKVPVVASTSWSEKST